MLSLVLLLVIAAFTSESSCRSLPSYLPKCCIDNPKLKECLLNATKTLKPYIRKGIKEIGIPSYTPLIVPHFDMKQESGSVNYTATVKNLRIRGMDNYNFTDFQYNPTTMKFSGEVGFTPVFLNTLYDMTGSILLIPTEGSGLAAVSIGPINSTFEISGNMTKRDKKEYYNPTDVKFVFTLDDMSVYMEGLFGGNDDLASTTNRLLNQNSEIVIKVVTPALASIVESFLARYVHWLFKSFPFEELFPRCN